MNIEQYARLAAVVPPEQLAPLSEVLGLPCNAACSKCGAREATVKFVPERTASVVDDPDDRFYVESDGCAWVLEHFLNTCEVCGHSWVSRTPGTPGTVRDFLEEDVMFWSDGREELVEMLEGFIACGLKLAKSAQEHLDAARLDDRNKTGKTMAIYDKERGAVETGAYDVYCKYTMPGVKAKDVIDFPRTKKRD